MAASFDTGLERAVRRSPRGQRGGSRPALIAALVLIAAGLVASSFVGPRSPCPLGLPASWAWTLRPTRPTSWGRGG